MPLSCEYNIAKQKSITALAAAYAMFTLPIRCRYAASLRWRGAAMRRHAAALRRLPPLRRFAF